ncbi:hypothetical protein [Helicobacter sp. 23-1045]
MRGALSEASATKQSIEFTSKAKQPMLRLFIMACEILRFSCEILRIA